MHASDDLEGDKPSCPEGVRRRLLREGIHGLKIAEAPENRVINYLQIKQVFTELFFDKKDNSILKSINSMNMVMLGVLEDAISNIVSGVSLSELEKFAIENLTPEFNELSEVIDFCHQYYGYNRFYTTGPIVAGAKSHKSGFELLKDLHANIFVEFGDVIQKQINAAKEKIQAQNNNLIFSNATPPLTPKKNNKRKLECPGAPRKRR